MKVCIEVVLMATDGGKVARGEEVIVVSGTRRGADTAAVAIASTSNRLNDLHITEILCKPLQTRSWARGTSPYDALARRRSSSVRIYLLVDFGSTYTKVLAVDIDAETIVGSAQAPTTVDTDIKLGLQHALDALEASCGVDLDAVEGRYASSSAAGGLRMAAIGLVPELTLEAARRACLGAGAKVVCGYGFEVDRSIIQEIESAHCDIVLLCGGTDGGDKRVITHNAQMLARSGVDCPILVAGNRVVNEDVTEILAGKGKRVYSAANVLPSLDIVQVEPAQALIREIFIAHITKAKGLEKAAGLFDHPVVPTPKATLQAAALLADGAGGEAGLGSLMIVEVGGATTNIHSVADQSPATPQTFVRGLPESRVKRTVEGDLGIRYNAPTIFEHIGREGFFSRLRALDPAVDDESCEPERYVRYLSATSATCPPRNSGSTWTSRLRNPRPASRLSDMRALCAMSSPWSERSRCSTGRICCPPRM